MGLAKSKYFDEFTSDEIADAVQELGQDYKRYADEIRRNGVDGFFLQELSDKELEETLDDLGVQDRRHRQVLKRNLENVLLLEAEEELPWENLEDDDDWVWDDRNSHQQRVICWNDSTSIFLNLFAPRTKDRWGETQFPYRKCSFNKAA